MANRILGFLMAGVAAGMMYGQTAGSGQAQLTAKPDATGVTGRVAVTATASAGAKIAIFDGVAPVRTGMTDASGVLRFDLSLTAGKHSLRAFKWGTGKAAGSAEADVPVRPTVLSGTATPYLSEPVQAAVAAVLRTGGARDLALAEAGAVVVLPNDGSGGFGDAKQLAGPNQPTAIAAADFDGDGLADVAVVGDGFVWLFRNDGTGSLDSPTKIAAGNGPVAIAVADFNGDGIPDLAVANRLSNDVSILTGDGMGSFGKPVSIPVGSDLRAIVAGDWNGDGIADLAVASFGSNEVVLLTGDGMGSLGNPVRIAAGNGPVALATADFDGDGKADVAVLNQLDSAIRLLLNANGFAPGTTVPVRAGADALAAGDVDGDGIPDLLAGGDTIDVFNGNGFENTLSVSAGFARDLILADLAGNGGLSVAAATDAGARILLNSPVLEAKTAEAKPMVTGASAAVATRALPMGSTAPSAITVASDADSGAGSLRQALADIVSGGTITITPGLDIVLQTPLQVNKTMTIQSLDFTNRPILESPLAGYAINTGFLKIGPYYQNQLMIITANVTLSGLVMRNGRAVGGNGTSGVPGGGGGAGMGGALFIDTPHVNIVNSEFDTNQALGGNGGVGAEQLDTKTGCCYWVFGTPGNSTADDPSYGAGQNGNGGGVNGQYGGQPSSSRTYTFTCAEGGCDPEIEYWGAGGGGGAGLGGAIFVRSGFTTISDTTFSYNGATGGNWAGDGGTDTCDAGQTFYCFSGGPNSNGTNGQGKGGAIFVAGGAAVEIENTSFSNDGASNAGSGDCSDNDNADICGAVGLNAVSSNIQATMTGTPRASQEHAFPVTISVQTYPGVSIEFTTPSKGASCTFGGSTDVTVQANSGGIANPGLCVANGVAGTFNVTVSVPVQAPQYIIGPFPGFLPTLEFASGGGTFSLTNLKHVDLTLSASANPSLIGSATTLTATLGSALATGYVEFLQGTTPVGTAKVVNGVATLTALMLQAGAQPLLARYSGDMNFGFSTSTTLAHTVKTNYGPAFRDPVTHGTAAYTQTAIADFNGDGRLDIAAAFPNGGTDGYVSIFTGRDGGGFAGPTNYTAGAGPQSLAVGDFNGDGKPDLAVGDAGGGIAILINGGSGTFSVGATLSHPAASSVVVADFDGDGNEDIAAITGPASAKRTMVTVWYGNGDGTFQSPVDYAGASTNAQQLVVMDMNALGFPDIVMANGDGGYDVLQGQAAGGFTEFHQPLTVLATGITAGDFNNDGVVDIALAGQITEVIHGAAGKPLTTTGPQGLYNVGRTWTQVQAAELYGNSYLDVLLAPAGLADIFRMAGSSTGEFLRDIAIGAGPGVVPTSMAVADLNGDGATDIVVTGGAGLITLIGERIPNSITANTGAMTVPVGQVFTTPLSVTVTDVNGPAAGLTVTFTGPSSGAGVTFPGGVNTAVTDENGVATITPTANSTAGAYTVTASVPLLSAKASFSITNAKPATLSVAVTTASGTYTQGQSNVTFNLTVNNTGGIATTGAITLQNTPGAGLNVTSLAGATGWSCGATFVSCTYSGSLAANASTTLTLTANIAGNAPASITEGASVTVGGTTVQGSDTVSINQTLFAMTITPQGSFVASAGAASTSAWVITVRNAGTTASAGSFSVADTLPQGATATAIGGQGWNCSATTLVCGRGDPLAAGASYPAITVSVSLASGVAQQITDTAVLAGLGPANVTATDSVNVTTTAKLTIGQQYSGPATSVAMGALSVMVGGTSYALPAQVSVPINQPVTVAFASPQVEADAGTQAVFEGWSDAGAASHSITPAGDTTLTVSFGLQFQVSATIYPPSAGSVTGTGWYAPGATAVFTETPGSGYVFSSWTGAASQSATSADLVVNGPANVGVNFAPLSPALTLAVSSKANGTDADQRVWTLAIANKGSGAASGVQITAATVTVVAPASGGAPVSIVTALPVSVGDIGAGQTASAPITLNYPASPITVVQLKVTLAANGGSYSTTVTLNNQLR